MRKQPDSRAGKTARRNIMKTSSRARVGTCCLVDSRRLSAVGLIQRFNFISGEFHRASGAVALAGLLGFWGTPASAQPFYAMKDLGTLGGPAASVNALNIAGEAVGNSAVAGGVSQHAFLYSHGRMRDLGTLGGSFSNANDINAWGIVVGSAQIGGDAADHAFVYSHGRMRDLGTLGGENSVATGINNRGEIVGVSQISDGQSHVFLYSHGRMKDLGEGFGADINDSGEVSGAFFFNVYRYHAFLYSGGIRIDLGTIMPGGAYSQAGALNAWGEVTGYSIADTGYHAFLYSNGAMHDLGDLGTDLPTMGMSINRWSQVVGTIGARINRFVPPPDFIDQRAFLYSGAMHDLNDLILRPNGTILRYGKAINDRGQIACDGVNAAGEEHAYLLTPIPEPGSPGWCGHAR